jgi:hypothetical protein
MARRNADVLLKVQNKSGRIRIGPAGLEGASLGLAISALQFGLSERIGFNLAALHKLR